LLLAVLALRHL